MNSQTQETYGSGNTGAIVDRDPDTKHQYRIRVGSRVIVSTNRPTIINRMILEKDKYKFIMDPDVAEEIMPRLK
ncbi:hypothetical protein CMI47_20735 [Candidatus Pacearchaeota archaeon]|nr:hypothetical protein [Candidatus Pacearchaeota archaeon]|tara:strand:+ start:631 stop:852 length:222 start_codon:yes stop_codon:yes gene_type:complete